MSEDRPNCDVSHSFPIPPHFPGPS